MCFHVKFCLTCFHHMALKFWFAIFHDRENTPSRSGPGEAPGSRWKAVTCDNTNHDCHSSTSQPSSGVDKRSSEGDCGPGVLRGEGGGLGFVHRCALSPFIRRIIHQAAACAQSQTFSRVPFIDRMRTARHESSANEEQERLHIFAR